MKNGILQISKFKTLSLRGLALSLWSLLVLLSTPKTFASIADIEQALTLTQIHQNGVLQTILVVSEGEGFFKGHNLSKAFDLVPEDSLDLIRLVGEEKVRSTITTLVPTRFLKKDIVVSPAIRQEHVAVGANYVAHGKEAGIETVFLFPKYAEPTGTHSKVGAPLGSLLDYEVELCARFDRDIASIQQFKESVKGIFLCGDFTDRAVLIRSIDVTSVESGLGFTDAKSGLGRFPVGPYTVVPRDWSGFLETVEMTLTVNGELRQQAMGAGMIKKLNHIVEDILFESGRPVSRYNWQYKGKPISLVSKGVIKKGQSLLTGTPEGVAFRPPSASFIVTHIGKWLFTFAFLEESIKSYVINRYIEEHSAAKSHLQPGDKVVLTATSLGEVSLTVTE